MENDHSKEMDMEVLSSARPEDIIDKGKQFELDNPGADEDMFEHLQLNEKPTSVDFNHLLTLTTYSEKSSSQLAKCIENWEYKQANAVRLLREELDFLSKQQKKAQLEKLIHRSEELIHGDNQRPVAILDGNYNIPQEVPWRKIDDAVHDQILEVEAECDTVTFWKERAMHLENLLDASLQREHIAQAKLQERIQNLESQSPPVEKLSQALRSANNYLHFILQNAPVVIGHQVT